MSLYLGIHPEAVVKNATVWDIDEKTATRIDAFQQEHVISLTPKIAIENHPSWTFVPLKLAPGQYHPRIARPSNHDIKELVGTNPASRDLRSVIEVSNGQLVALKEQLERIWRVVHPAEGTMDAFGHDIRNLLILACTEVEAHWKGVLSANGAKGNTTRDYVKLAEPMQLSAYQVSFPYYPWMDPVQPFKDWKPSRTPTQDLSWYHAYNSVKHDREANFPNATLRNSINAVCACFVMQCAQFGTPPRWAREELRSFFHVAVGPVWDPSLVYCAPPQGTAFEPVNYAF